VAGASTEQREAITSFATPTTSTASSYRCMAATSAKGTLNQIIEASGVAREDFLKLL